MESKLEKIAYLKRQIEELQTQIICAADCIKQQVVTPGSVYYIIELADRVKQDARFVQERFDAIRSLERARGIDIPTFHR